MRHKNLGLVVAAIFVLAACATTDQKAPQTASKTAIEKIVSTDVNATWDALVSGLDRGDFKINALAEGDRTIRVLLSSGTPSHFVDCGEISVRSRHPQFGVRNYNFPAANSARYLVADGRADALVDVERRTSLNALANIQLVPNGNGTLVRINAQYVMNFRTREFGNKASTRSIDDSLNFNSLGRASLDEQVREGSSTKTVKIECQPTGELERRIVAVLNRTAG